jgi:hypothetical protein
MSRLEDDLRHTLARCEPPAGFTERVMSRLSPARNRRWSHSRFAAAAAAVLVSILGGGAYQYQRTEKMRQEGERAKAELVFALEVASVKLQETRTKVVKSSQGEL